MMYDVKNLIFHIKHLIRTKYFHLGLLFLKTTNKSSVCMMWCVLTAALQQTGKLNNNTDEENQYLLLVGKHI